MPTETSIEEARKILGNAVVGASDAAAAFDVRWARGELPIPYAPARLNEIAANGELLIFRHADFDGTPLTILEMIRRQPSLFDSRFLQKMGYQLKDEWGIELEPSAATDTCNSGWAVVRRDVLGESLNLAYEQQDGCLSAWAAKLGLPANSVRRRTAVEIVYDVLVMWQARKVRLLEKTWDWSSSRTVDGGYLNAGGFGNRGLQIFSYSRAVRHGALGICPARTTNQ